MTDTKPTVLIVEDDEETRNLISAHLEEQGYGTVCASDGRAALDVLTAARPLEPCLILLDLMMEGMNGWELLAILKGYHRLAQIPVIVVSAMKPHLEAIEHKAVMAVIRKPFRFEALDAAIAMFRRAT